MKSGSVRAEMVNNYETLTPTLEDYEVLIKSDRNRIPRKLTNKNSNPIIKVKY